MNWVSAPGELRKFRPSRQDAVRPQVDIVTPVFVVQNLAVAWHQYGDRVRQEQHACGYGAGKAIQRLMLYSRIFQFHCVHQVMKCHMSVAATQTSQKWRHQSAESDQRIPSKCTEEEIEPNYVWLKSVQCPQQTIRAARVVERPAARDRKSVYLHMAVGQSISKDCQIQERVALQLLRNVKPVFA